jgi:SNF family Na+-dependent transporter
MGLPIVTTIIFVGRALSLPNASEGVALVWRTWRSDQLASGTVWQVAVGQVFFSTGIGFVCANWQEHKAITDRTRDTSPHMRVTTRNIAML